MSAKSKRRWSMRAAAGFMGLIVSVSAAFFLTTYIGDGSHEGKTGTHAAPKTLPVLISFPESQLAPEHPVEVTAKLENTTGKAVSFQKLKLTAETPTVPKCGSEWLKFREEGGTEPEVWQGVVNGTQSPGAIPAGTSNILTNGGKLFLEFDPSKNSVDETSCENVPVIVKGHLE